MNLIFTAESYLKTCYTYEVMNRSVGRIQSYCINISATLVQEQAGGDWGVSSNVEEQVQQIKQLSDQLEMLHLNVGQKDRRISQLEEEITRTREISVSKSVFLLHIFLFFPHLDTFYGLAQKVQNKDR